MPFQLRLTNSSGDLFTVHEHEDTATRCRMNLSHFDAERLRMFINETGILTDANGYAVHSVRILTSTPDPRFGPLSPTVPGGGEATCELLS